MVLRETCIPMSQSPFRLLIACLVLLAVPAAHSRTEESAHPELPLADGFRGIWYANQPSGDEYRFKYSGGLGT